ncbi:MAG: outer membrane protein assembly factor BamB [Burkholderiaceae bacterium]
MVAAAAGAPRRIRSGSIWTTLVVAASLATAVLLAGCAGSPKPKPQPLEVLTPQIALEKLWSQRTGSVNFPLAVAVSRGVFIVAGSDGTVLALDAASGHEIWRASAGAKISAGVGSDGRFSSVVTTANELVTFEQGQVKWSKALGTRVVTAPLVAGERVFVLGVDRSVQAFDALDGHPIWVLRRPGDPLTLAQAGVLTAFDDTLIVGQGPRLAGVDPSRGSVRWEVAVGTPRGANEIERLADLVGPAARVGNLFCVRSFQAAVGCVDAARGALVWSNNVGGTEGVAADAQYVFGADASDRLSAWKMASGDTAWTSDTLKYRGLGAPLSVGTSVVFGDSDGTLHWLARDTGAPQLRVPTDGSAIAAAPVVSGSTLLVVTRNGGLFAYRTP